MPAAPTSRTFLGTLALVFVSIAGMFTLDTFLEKTERAESRIEAARLFEHARELMRRGLNLEAIDPLKGALAIDRTNRDYQLVLAQAQLGAGESADAESTLNGILQIDSTDGAATLAMARVLMKEGRANEGISYYHRAIYGHWSDDAAGNRLRVRSELIDLLAQRGAKEELLAELLPLQAEAPDDVATRAKLGHLYLIAGSAARAADIFRDVLHQQPMNHEAHSGLGEAEFATGNYRAAQNDFRAALQLKPADPEVRQRLDLAAQILALDPMQRGLTAAERYQRSLKLIEDTLAEAEPCASDQDLVEQARKDLKKPVPMARESDAAEANLDVAERLWQVRKRDCKPVSANDPLALVFAKVAR
jgi:Tfp pilus assembly protein PilF